ncbi:hypothetical protein THAOC_21021, partial [Thalassiosira oceanica]
ALAHGQPGLVPLLLTRLAAVFFLLPPDVLRGFVPGRSANGTYAPAPLVSKTSTADPSGRMMARHVSVAVPSGETERWAQQSGTEPSAAGPPSLASSSGAEPVAGPLGAAGRGSAVAPPQPLRCSTTASSPAACHCGRRRRRIDHPPSRGAGPCRRSFRSRLGCRPGADDGFCRAPRSVAPGQALEVQGSRRSRSRRGVSQVDNQISTTRHASVVARSHSVHARRPAARPPPHGPPPHKEDADEEGASRPGPSPSVSLGPPGTTVVGRRKLRGKKKKKKAKEQRRDAPALDTGPVQTTPGFLASGNLDDSGNAVPRASSSQTTRMQSTQGTGRPSPSISIFTIAKVISVIRESQPQLIRLPPDGYWAANYSELSGLTDCGLLGALLIRVHYGFDENCEESFAGLDDASIQESLSKWFNTLVAISLSRFQRNTKLIPVYLERDIPHPLKQFYSGFEEEHDPKTWIALVFCKVVDRLISCDSFYKSKMLYQGVVNDVIRVLATLEQIHTNEDGIMRLNVNYDEYYPHDAMELLVDHEEFLKFTCKEMVRCCHTSKLDHGSDVERKFENAACYVRCILGYRAYCWKSHHDFNDRMFDIALLPTTGEGSIFIRDIIAILRAKSVQFDVREICLNILDRLVSCNCVDEKIIQDLVHLAGESKDRYPTEANLLILSRRGMADIAEVLYLLESIFESVGGNTHQGSVERRVGVAVKAGLLDVIIGFLSIIAENPKLQGIEYNEDALSAAYQALIHVEQVANKKKARVAIIDCQKAISEKLSSLRQLLWESDECDDVLDKLQSVLDEGLGPVARNCSVCSRILGSEDLMASWAPWKLYRETKKVYRTNLGMLEDHAKFMLGVWMNQGKEELVKAMEEAPAFPRARATVLTGCVSILKEKHDSDEWAQVSAMIIALYESNLVSKSDIGAGISSLAFSMLISNFSTRDSPRHRLPAYNSAPISSPDDDVTSRPRCRPAKETELEEMDGPSRRHLVDVEVDPPPPAGSVLDQALCVDVLKPAMDVDPAAVAAVVLEVELVGFLPDGVDPAAEGAAPTGAAQGGVRGRPPELRQLSLTVSLASCLPCSREGSALSSLCPPAVLHGVSTRPVKAQGKQAVSRIMARRQRRVGRGRSSRTPCLRRSRQDPSLSGGDPGAGPRVVAQSRGPPSCHCSTPGGVPPRSAPSCCGRLRRIDRPPSFMSRSGSPFLLILNGAGQQEARIAEFRLGLGGGGDTPSSRALLCSRILAPESIKGQGAQGAARAAGEVSSSIRSRRRLGYFFASLLDAKG